MTWRRKVRNWAPHLPLKWESAAVCIGGVVSPACNVYDTGVARVHTPEEEEHEEEIRQIVDLESGFVAVWG